MRQFLVIGCGGAGGATLAYMMDQLRSDLAPHGVDRLPRGWQFVHIDVPSSPDVVPGVANVREQGGRYLACAPQGGSYPVLDDAVSAQLAEQPIHFGEIASWAPRSPRDVAIPLGEGAGQYRALGRMITLAQLNTIYAVLSDAWTELGKTESTTELSVLGRTVPGVGSFVPNTNPSVLVVSSMSGGSGSSMVLDVCRLLSAMRVPTEVIGVFVFSADVFDRLPREDQKRGVRSNGLAMLGEIIASQTGSALGHDEELFAALGLKARAQTPVPFARIFPIGRFVGTQQTEFGDGQPATIYRGLARGLAALMMSGPACEPFMRYDLTNRAALDEHGDYLGWGTSDRSWVPWGSFGYSCLSLGRERYREYCAQRIARGVVDHLVSGHMRLGSTASGTDQLKALITSQWPIVCGHLRLPADGGNVSWSNWLTQIVFPDLEQIARQIVSSDISPNIPVPSQATEANSWLAALRPQLALQRSRVSSSAAEAAYARVYQWQRDMAASIVSTVEDGLSRFGLPYGRALVAQIGEHLEEVVLRPAQRDSRYATTDPTVVPEETQQRLTRLKGAIRNAQQVLENLIDELRNPLRTLILGRACVVIEQACAGLKEDVLGPLGAAIGEALDVLTVAQSSEARAQVARGDGA